MADADTAASTAPRAGAAQWLVYSLAGLSLVLAITQIFWPARLLAAVMLVIPLVVLGVVLAAPASFETGTGKGRILNGSLMLPFAALLIVNTYDAQINPWWPLIPGAFAGVAVMIAAWKVKDQPGVTNPWTVLIFLSLCAAAYGYGAVAVADIHFDSAAGTILRVPVLGKHEYHSRRSDTYHLDLPAWGPRNGPNTVEVSSSTYETLNAGDTVCITLHPGALSLPWFTADVCGKGWGG